MGTTPIYGFPYPDPSDLVANYPALGQQLAEDVETEIAASSVIVQVVSTFKADVFTATSTSLVDVTGLTATITPASATNKILVTVSLSLNSGSTGNASRAVILRGSTVVGGGTAVGNRGSITYWSRNSTAGDGYGATSFTFVDSPATTSATTYKVQGAVEAGLVTIGYSYPSDNDIAAGGRIGSSIVLMEIKA